MKGSDNNPHRPPERLRQYRRDSRTVRAGYRHRSATLPAKRVIGYPGVRGPPVCRIRHTATTRLSVGRADRHSVLEEVHAKEASV